MMERHAYLSSPRVLLVALPDATRIKRCIYILYGGLVHTS